MSNVPAARLAPEAPHFRPLARPRLLRPVLAGQPPRLAVLCAPPGFGKTTLLREWREALLETGARVAWLRLDAADAGPDDVAASIAGALHAAGLPQTIDADLAGRSWRERLLALIRAIEAEAAPHWLMLDDHHCLAEAAGEAISFLLRNAPERLHLVMAGRRTPALALAQMRVANQLVELSAAELRFDGDETRRFFQQEMPARVDPFDAAQFAELTQGWPAGLRMAAQELAHAIWHKDALAGFAGLPRNVRAYFDECVAAPVPEEELAALARMAILDEIDPALGAALAGPGAGDLLRKMRAGEHFAERVDESGERFRLHPLFRRYLRSRLEQEGDGDIAALHRQASACFAARQDWPRAVDHAFAAGDTAQAVEWAESCVLVEVGRGNLAAVLDWAARIPGEELLRRRLLLAAAGTTYALSLRLDEARAVADLLDDAIAAGPGAPDMPALLLQRAVLRICIAYMSDDGPALLVRAEEARAAVVERWPDSIVANAFIHGHLIAGDLDRARACQTPGMLDCDEDRTLFSVVCQLCLLGLCDVAENRFAEAEHRFRDALELAARRGGPNTAPSALAASLLASVRYEYGELEEAEALLGGRLDLVEQTCLVEGLLACYVTLARVHAGRGRWQAAQALLERGADLGRRRDWLRLRGACIAEQARICLQRGRVAAARNLLSSLRAMLPPEPIRQRSPADYVRRLHLLCEGRMLLASGKAQPAAALFERYAREEAWDDRDAFQARICHATALMACSRRGPAIEAMTELIARGQAGETCRSFIDEGQASASLARAAVAFLREADDGRVDPACLDRLDEELRRATDGEADTASEAALAGRLTERERDLLGRVRLGMTNKEIANDLGIGVETVKWHLKSIFRKLNARNRTEAIAYLRQPGRDAETTAVPAGRA